MIQPLLKSPSRLAVSTAAFLVLASGSAQAHPGHSLHQSTPAHVLTSPYHLVVLALTGATIVLAASRLERRLPRSLLQWLGVAVVTTAVLLRGFLP